MRTRQEIVNAAMDHHHMVKQAPGDDTQYRYHMAGYEPEVVWAVWIDETAADNAGMRVIKGWDKVLDPNAKWGAVIVGDLNEAVEDQENYGDGEESVDRADWPEGALAA